MTDDHEESTIKTQELEQQNERLRDRQDKLFRLLRKTQTRLGRAEKEIAGREAYEEDLKAAFANQHIELCELQREYTSLRIEAAATRALLDEYTPYRGMNIQISHATRWLIQDKNHWRRMAERDQRELQPLKDERCRATGLLMDHGIYKSDLEDGIKELLSRRNKALRSWLWRRLLSGAS